MQKPTDANETTPAVVAVPSSVQYTGWVLRTGALILDIILLCAIWLVFYCFSFLLPNILYTFYIYASVLISFSFHIVLEIWRGSSVGKQVFGLRVVSTKGSKLSWRRTLGRVCVRDLMVFSILGSMFLSWKCLDVELTHGCDEGYDWLVFGILLLIPGVASLITMIFSATKQTFYDKWFGSVIVSKDKGNVGLLLLAFAEMVFVVEFLLFIRDLCMHSGKLL